jgi:hypothetical protein
MKPSAFGWKLKPKKQETVRVFQKLGYGVFTESDHRILSNCEGHKVAATPDVAVVQLWNHQFAMPDSNQRHAVRETVLAKIHCGTRSFRRRMRVIRSVATLPITFADATTIKFAIALFMEEVSQGLYRSFVRGFP